MSKRNIVDRVRALTGASRSTIEQLKKEFDNGPLVTPGKKRPNRQGRKTRMKVYTDFQKTAIRRKVHELYRKNIPPTSKTVAQMINEDPDLPHVTDRTTRRLLNDLGFKFERRQRQSYLIEREDIVQWRRKYLIEVKRFREEGKQIFYLDESWCNAGHTTKKAWTPKYIKSARQAHMNGETTGLRDLPGRGGRLIMVHIGSEDGFLKDPTNPSGDIDARWVFKAKKTAKIENANHHDEMNGKAFQDWFEGIIHLLPPDSVIVMDNASYHSETLFKIPNMSWKKKDIQNFLTSHGVFFNLSDVKAELLTRIPAHLRLAAKTYKIDKIAEDCGHTVLRLPPYHCELNPIELVWAKVKNEVARTNTDYSLKSVETLLDDALNNVTANDWKSFVNHVKKVEEFMWEVDAIIDDVQDRLVISLADGDDSTTDFEEISCSEDSAEYSDDELARPL
ncbi:uncharacterized protein LOC128989301 [Macrosteles quadrilineatus]|uniref:uncharacterized protein LOC128989301 n=1 Tax=Macrosteles quadrilineatus TaxID=74068 RepID=UPI0023E2E491|nr:uncharacterized protein LOC128989301 [Macrosteles quadrilineatus]